jgi:RNA 2',3'-cyclic 3'-phosphodiesterase
MAGETVRLFVGSPVTGEAREALLHFYDQRQSLESILGSRIRWVAPENWHLTWAFLGAIPEPEVALIQARLHQALKNTRAGVLSLTQTAFWPTLRHPRQLVWEGDPSVPSILAIYKQVYAVLPTFLPEKTFRPHITLARFKTADPRRFSQIPSTLWPKSQGWGVEAVHLYQSTLSPQGPRYDSLSHWILQK